MLIGRLTGAFGLSLVNAINILILSINLIIILNIIPKYRKVISIIPGGHQRVHVLSSIDKISLTINMIQAKYLYCSQICLQT